MQTAPRTLSSHPRSPVRPAPAHRVRAHVPLCARLLCRTFACLLLLWAIASHAAVFQGTLRYSDFNPAAGSSRLQPVIGTEVTAVRLIPTVANLGTTTTDTTGFFRFNLNVNVGEVISVVVRAENSAAIIHELASVSGDVVTRQFQRVISNTGATFDLSQDFADSAIASAFNIADTLRRGLAYANARRDPRETDAIGKVHVQPSSVVEKSFFRPGDGTFLENTIMLNPAKQFEDFGLLHEYAHFLEHRIGSFMALPSHHDGCFASSDENHTVLLNSPEQAWMEAFADFFSAAVARANPTAFQGHTDGGTIPPNRMEARPVCLGLPASVTSDAVELNVAALLFDLMDGTSIGEPWDRQSNRETIIFQIMDHEMDTGLDFPNIHDFRRAWRDRDLPIGDLERIVFHDLPGFGFEFNPPADQSFRFDDTVCRHIVNYTGPTLLGTVAIPLVRCTPASGSDFPVGTTTVTCVLSDFTTELDRVSFHVTVEASTPAITRGTGLLGTYYDTMGFGSRILQRLDRGINFNWGANAPHPLMGADTFSVRWSGYFVPPYSGTYTFTIRADEAAQLSIGETMVLTQAGHAQVTETSGTIALEAGRLYPIRVDYYENTGDASMQLLYATDCIGKQVVPAERLFPPVMGTGLAATYYGTADNSAPLVTRIDPTIDFSWGSRAPIAGIHGTKFHVLWTGKVRPDCSGDYTFFAGTDGGARLVVGGRVLIDGLDSNPATEQSGVVHLEQGQFYDMSLEVKEPQGNAAARLFWAGPCTPKSIIDADHLFSFHDELSHDTLNVGNQWLLSGPSYTPNVNPLSPSPFTEFHLIAQPFHGNGEVIARLAAHTGLAGLMVRDGWTTASPEVFLGIDENGNGVFWTKGGLGTQRQVRSVNLTPDTATWLKLSRSGDQIAAATSTDGVNWQVVATDTCPCSSTAWYGAGVQGTPTVVIGPVPKLKSALLEGLVVQATPADPCCLLGAGLLASFYDGTDLTVPRHRQIHPQINFAWRNGPGGPVNPNAFSARWTGTLIARSTEAHTFTLRTDGGVRLFIDGRLLIDAWNGGTLAERNGTITLQDGQTYDVRIEFRKQGANGTIQWFRQTPTRARQLVASSDLTPVTQSAQDIPSLANTGVDSAGVALPDNWKDTRYSVQVNEGQVTSPYAARAAGGPPIGPWLRDRPNSAWIAPTVDTMVEGDAVTRYSIWFDLTGLEANSALIVGRIAADGVSVAIELNGYPIGATFSPHYDAWSTFVVLDHFKTRGNTLTFIVRNNSGVRNPSGVRVELCGKVMPRCSDVDEVRPGPVSNPWLHDGFRFNMASAAGVPWSMPEIRTETVPITGASFTGLNFGSRLEIDLPHAAYLIRATLMRGASAPTVTTYNADGIALASAVMTAAEGVAQTIDLGGRGISRVVITAPQNEVLLLGFCPYLEPVLTIENMTLSAGGTQVTFSSVSGRTYCLQARDSWDQPWVDIVCVRANSSSTVLTDPAPPVGSMRIYRVVERL